MRRLGDSILATDKQGFSHRCNLRRKERQNSEIVQDFAYLEWESFRNVKLEVSIWVRKSNLECVS